MYKLVDRYISTTFITNVVMILIVFIILFLLVDVVEHLNYIIDSTIPQFELYRYFLYSVPWYASLGQPMALLLGTVFTLGILHKNNDELYAFWSDQRNGNYEIYFSKAINESIILGDINQDSVIDILDVVRMINFILGQENPNTIEEIASDLNSDGIINIQDVILIINIILN